MSDEQDPAEALDDDVIAAEETDLADPDPTGEGRFTEIAALEEDFPPDEPLGVEVPGRYAIEDDLADREDRQEDELE